MSDDGRKAAKMWLPNRRQWRVIWLGVALYFLLQLGATLSNNIDDRRIFELLSRIVVVGTVLMVWRRHGQRSDRD